MDRSASFKPVSSALVRTTVAATHGLELDNKEESEAAAVLRLRLQANRPKNHRALLSQPNTPLAALLIILSEGEARSRELAQERIAREWAESADFDLWVLAQDNDYRVRRTLAQLGSDWPLGHVPSNKEISKLLESHPDFGAVLDSFEVDPDPRVRRVAAASKRTKLPAQRQLALDDDVDVRVAVANRKAVSGQVLQILALSSDEAVQRAVLQQPKCDESMISNIAQTASSEVLSLIAQLTQTSVADLERLARHEDSRIRESVAKHPHTSSPTLSYLASVGDITVLRALAGNVRTSPEILASLVTMQDKDTLLALVANPSTPPESLGTMLTCGHLSVMRALADNPSTPPDVLAQLASVRFWMSQWKGMAYQPILTSVAAHPNASAQTLETLGKWRDLDVLVNVARNPNTPPEVLSRLALEAPTALRRANGTLQ